MSRLVSLEPPLYSGEHILEGIWPGTQSGPSTNSSCAGYSLKLGSHPHHLQDRQEPQSRVSGRFSVRARQSRTYSLVHTALQVQTPEPSSSMPRTSCLGRPFSGALAMSSLVRQTSHSRSVSAWRAGVQSGHTPPGKPSRTGLRTSSLSALMVDMIVGLGQCLWVPEGRVHSVPQQGEGIHIIKSGVPGRNLWCGDPIGQLLPGLQPPDSPVVMTQLGGHFQTVVHEYHSMAGCSGMATEEVHIMTVHRHYEVLKGLLIGYSGDSGFLPPNILNVIPGRKIKVVPASVFCIYECLKATTKIKTI